MISEIELLEIENIGNIITIIAYLIFFASALMSIKMEQSAQTGSNLKVTPAPSEVVANGSFVYALGSLVIFAVSLERTKQRSEQLQAGTASGTLLPNLWISVSTLLTFISALALIKGSQLRVLEEGQITII